jgi:hypothetical protein
MCKKVNFKEKKGFIKNLILNYSKIGVSIFDA